MSIGSLDNTSVAPDGAVPPAAAQLARRILDALHGLRFGSVEVVVHDGHVVQIERREKVRLNSPAQPGLPVR